MALSGTVVWEVRIAGSGSSDLNGGGYKSDAGTTDYSQQDAPQLALTDVVANGSTTLTSVTGGFTAAMVGNVCYVQGGTGSIAAGWYQIATRSDTNTITVDRATGLTAGTGVTMNVGGALASPGVLTTAQTVSGQLAWIKAGTYTLTTDTPGSAGPVAIGNSVQCGIEGYNATRGDLGTAPVISAGARTGITLVTMGTSQFEYIVNIAVDGNSGAGNNGFSLDGSKRLYAYLCLAENCLGYGFGNDGPFIACQATNCATGFAGTETHYCVAIGCVDGFSNPVTANQCLAHGCSNNGFVITSLGKQIVNCISDGNTDDGFDLSGSPHSMLVNCLASNNGGYGFYLGVTMLMNCASYNNTSGATNTTPFYNLGPITLSADPYVNQAGDDFRLNNAATGGALCIGAGIGVYGQTGPAHVGAVAPAIDFPAVGEVEVDIQFGYNSSLTGTKAAQLLGFKVS